MAFRPPALSTHGLAGARSGALRVSTIWLQYGCNSPPEPQSQLQKSLKYLKRCRF